MQKQERISCYSHVMGMLIAVIGTVVLLIISKRSTADFFVSGVYGFSVIFLFGASSLYHALKKQENEESFWRRLDHVAIFFMIAGTYTPICYIYLTGYLKWTIIIFQWTLVILGFFFKMFYLKAPRLVYTMIYLIMGWIGIIPMRFFFNNMPLRSIILLFAGGIAFTLGTFFYIIKKPKAKLGFHEIFHFFVLLGGICHYFVVYSGMVGK